MEDFRFSYEVQYRGTEVPLREVMKLLCGGVCCRNLSVTSPSEVMGNYILSALMEHGRYSQSTHANWIKLEGKSKHGLCIFHGWNPIFARRVLYAADKAIGRFSLTRHMVKHLANIFSRYWNSNMLLLCFNWSISVLINISAYLEINLLCVARFWGKTSCLVLFTSEIA